MFAIANSRLSVPGIFAAFAVVVVSVPLEGMVRAQESPTLPDPNADEQGAQQDQLVQGASAKTIGAPLGADSVGPDGSFVYSIPLRPPKGVGGVQPSLSLVYSS